LPSSRGNAAATNRDQLTELHYITPIRNLPSILDSQNGRIAAGRELFLSRTLVRIRASLIAPTRRLAMIRPHLVPIARHLVTITRRLLLLRASSSRSSAARSRLSAASSGSFAA
jgi:hypothetical protein